MHLSIFYTSSVITKSNFNDNNKKKNVGRNLILDNGRASLQNRRFEDLKAFSKCAVCGDCAMTQHRVIKFARIRSLLAPRHPLPFCAAIKQSSRAAAMIATHIVSSSRMRASSRRVPLGRMTSVITGYPEGQLFYIRTHYVTGN